MPNICETCQKATGGCAWADKFKPVEGWTANKVALKLHTGKTTTSYQITACPEYVQDEKLKDINFEGMLNLLNAHLSKSVQEYIQAVKHYDLVCDLCGNKSEKAQLARQQVRIYERDILPENIAQTALRKYRNGTYDPDKVNMRNRAAKKVTI